MPLPRIVQAFGLSVLGSLTIAPGTTSTWVARTKTTLRTFPVVVSTRRFCLSLGKQRIDIKPTVLPKLSSRMIYQDSMAASPLTSFLLVLLEPNEGSVKTIRIEDDNARPRDILNRMPLPQEPLKHHRKHASMPTISKGKALTGVAKDLPNSKRPEVARSHSMPIVRSPKTFNLQSRWEATPPSPSKLRNSKWSVKMLPCLPVRRDFLDRGSKECTAGARWANITLSQSLHGPEMSSPTQIAVGIDSIIVEKP